MNEIIQYDKTDIDDLIEQLPDQFPAAQDKIKYEIAPHLVDCSAGIRDHYIKVIKKRTNAASIKSVSLLIDEAVKEINDSVFNNDEKSFEETRIIDPEIQEMAEKIASDPLLFKNRIEMVNKLGVIGEKRNIGTYMVVIDSSLLPMGTSGSEALAAKNSGPQGSGKSHPLFTTLKLYPKSAYYLITSGSAKSLYNLNDGLKHKALILTEALQLQSGRQGDNELAYSIRTLVSEGHLKYQYTGFIDKKKVTIVQELKGPTSLLTTTIHGKLEEQLEDRMITIHPNTTAEQTRDIISRTAEMASGNRDAVDKKTLDSWKLFYESLEPVVVVIPYAKDIAEFINRNGSLPITARRAFKRVLTTIKTIALIHQRQRRRDDMGNVIAE
jgi:DNA primase